MIILQNHEQVESLFCRGAIPSEYPAVSIIYFTAGWCQACKKLDVERIEASFPRALFYKLDVDQLQHSAGWCNVSRIPAFQVLLRGKYREPIVCSDTDTAIQKIQEIIDSAV